MEPLLVDNAEHALQRARQLMGEHSNVIAAHIFRGDELIATLTVEEVEP